MRDLLSAPLLAGGAVALVLGAAGTAVAHGAGLALPGAVIGLVALAVLLHLSPALDRGAGALFDRVAPHMVLLFVPAGSGVVARAADLSGDWLVLGAAVLIGTPATVAVAGLAAQALLARRMQGRGAAR
jgi:holin-like protein